MSVLTNLTGATPQLGLEVMGEAGNQGGLTLYTYDLFGRQIGLQKADMTASYAYNPNNLRRSKTVNGVQTIHVWDGDKLAADLDVSANVIASYTRGHALISERRGSTSQFYLYNGHGDVVQLTDTSGNVVNDHTYDYDAFGVERDIQENDQNPFRYCGEYFDGTFYQEKVSDEVVYSEHDHTMTFPVSGLSGSKTETYQFSISDKESGAYSLDLSTNTPLRYNCTMAVTIYADDNLLVSQTFTGDKNQTVSFDLNGESQLKITCDISWQATIIGLIGATASLDIQSFRKDAIYKEARGPETYYLRARYYDPSLGRLTSQDTHWNTRNMIYGDREYKPGEIRFPDNNAIIQSGNLYAYCMNNPIIYSDEDGEVAIIVTILIGAGAGAIIGGGANAIGQLINGKKVSELDWKSIGIAAASGAVSGALAGSGIGLVGQIAANAALSGATSVVIQKTYNGSIDWKQVALDSGIGGLAGAIGGKGAQAGVKQVISKVQNVGTSFMSVTKLVFNDPTIALAAKKELVKALTKQGLTSLVIVVKDNIVTIEAKGVAKNGK